MGQGKGSDKGRFAGGSGKSGSKEIGEMMSMTGGLLFVMYRRRLQPKRGVSRPAPQTESSEYLLQILDTSQQHNCWYR